MKEDGFRPFMPDISLGHAAYPPGFAVASWGQLLQRTSQDKRGCWRPDPIRRAPHFLV